jgi:hypothetical protein
MADLCWCGRPGVSVAANMVIVVLARYRYRIEPTGVQQGLLARTFGCCRVVFNDAVRAREDARAAGEKIGPAEVQRRVITCAKTREDRAWLGEVAPTPLPVLEREAGLDLGIARLATVADTDGRRRDIANPKHLQRGQRTLAGCSGSRPAGPGAVRTGRSPGGRWRCSTARSPGPAGITTTSRPWHWSATTKRSTWRISTSPGWCETAGWRAPSTTPAGPSSCG